MMHDRFFNRNFSSGTITRGPQLHSHSHDAYRRADVLTRSITRNSPNTWSNQSFT